MRRLLPVIGFFCLIVGMTAPLSAQETWPGPQTPGSVLRYRLRSGSTLRDSVLSRRADTIIVERRRYSSANVLELRTIRWLFVSRSGGIVADQFGSQRLFPTPWPPKGDWSYSYRGSRYRYTPLERQSITLASHSLSALKVQLSVESQAGAVIADLWMVPNVGIVRTVTRPSGSANDYELVELRVPATLAAVQTEQSLPKQSPPVDTIAKALPVSPTAMDSASRYNEDAPRFTLQHAASGFVGLLTTTNEGTGMSLAAAYTALVRSTTHSTFVAANLTPLDLGIMPPDPNSRYQSETLSNGNTVCRDRNTGQFADKSNCGARTIYAVNAELIGGMAFNTRMLAFGAGLRGGNSSGPYAVAAFFFSPRPHNTWQIRARVGQHIADFGIGGTMAAGRQ